MSHGTVLQVLSKVCCPVLFKKEMYSLRLYAMEPFVKGFKLKCVTVCCRVLFKKEMYSLRLYAMEPFVKGFNLKCVTVCCRVL
mgnify:CR=1 FL=1